MGLYWKVLPFLWNELVNPVHNKWSEWFVYKWDWSGFAHWFNDAVAMVNSSLDGKYIYEWFIFNQDLEYSERFILIIFFKDILQCFFKDYMFQSILIVQTWKILTHF